MICPHITIRFGKWIGCNVCARCGETDDPESASYWTRDDDNDRICHACIEKGEPISTQNPVLDPIRDLMFARMAFANVRMLLAGSKTREAGIDAEGIRKRVLDRLERAMAKAKFQEEKEISS